jgi:uncharacterized protein (DUF849 family)
MSDSVIVNVAITGAVHTPSMSPYLPITARQITDEVLRVHAAGAAVAHIHVRDETNGRPVTDMDLFAQIASEVRSRCDIVLNFTTGGGKGMPVEERLGVIDRFRPELASCNYGSMNFSWFPAGEKRTEWIHDWEEEFVLSTEDYIFKNTFSTLKLYGEVFAAAGTVPELELYDLGMINNVAFMLERGHLQRPLYLQFVLGILGGAAATVESLAFLRSAARDAIGGEFEWSVAAAGKHQIPMCTAALLLGGHVRVGLEDSLYLERGRLATSNAEQVDKVVRIAHDLGREPATPDEARKILGLKGLSDVNF